MRTRSFGLFLPLLASTVSCFRIKSSNRYFPSSLRFLSTSVENVPAAEAVSESSTAGAIPVTSSADLNPTAPPAELFVGNVPFEVTKDELWQALTSRVGTITNLKYSINKLTGRPRGFAHLEFESKENAESAIEILKGTEINGRQLRFDFAVKKEEREKTAAAGATTPRQPASEVSIGYVSEKYNIDNFYFSRPVYISDNWIGRL